MITTEQLKQIRFALRELNECAGCPTCARFADPAIAILNAELGDDEEPTS